MLLFGDIGRAEQFVDRALALDPNHAWAWTRRGFLHVYRGNPAAGRPCFERAIRLSPLDPFSFNCFIGLGLTAFAEGRPDEAAGWTRKALHQKPAATWMFRDLATFLAHAGQIEPARAALAQFTASRPGIAVSTVADALHYFEPDLLSRYLDGLSRAGLPSEPVAAPAGRERTRGPDS
jgi:adenylate cyclase